MTLGNFRDVLSEFAKAGGTSYVAATNSSGLDLVIDRALKVFTRHTYSLYTVGKSIGVYSTEPTYSIAPIWEPTAASINGSTLKNRDGVQGFESLSWLTQKSGDISLSQTGTPTYAVVMPQMKLRLWPVPDGSYSLKVNGFSEHASIVGSGDSAVLEIEDAWADVAIGIASQLLKAPHADGNSVFGEMMAKDSSLNQRISIYASQNRGVLQGPIRRTPYQGRFNI